MYLEETIQKKRQIVTGEMIQEEREKEKSMYTQDNSDSHIADFSYFLKNFVLIFR